MTARLLFAVARSGERRCRCRGRGAGRAQAAWAATPAVQRGVVLHRICNALEAHAAGAGRDRGARRPASRRRTRSARPAARSRSAASSPAKGQRLYGRTTTSGAPDKYAMTVRQPCGVAGLIIAANTPIANVAWKVFPALICGNAAVLKAAEDTPGTAWLFAKIAHEAGAAGRRAQRRPGLRRRRRRAARRASTMSPW